MAIIRGLTWINPRITLSTVDVYFRPLWNTVLHKKAALSHCNTGITAVWQDTEKPVNVCINTENVCILADNVYILAGNVRIGLRGVVLNTVTGLRRRGCSRPRVSIDVSTVDTSPLSW